MRDYQPYKTDSFLELMRLCYNMAWYSGVRDLFTIRMVGQFEGHGRASECWEHDFIVMLAEVNATPEQAAIDAIYHGSDSPPSLQAYSRENSLPGGVYRSDTLEAACRKAVLAIRDYRGSVGRGG